MGNNPISFTDSDGGHTDSWFKGANGEVKWFSGKHKDSHQFSTTDDQVT